MSELQKIEDAFEAFIGRAETEAEKLLAEGAALLKNTIKLIAADPALKEAISNGLPIAVNAVLGAAEGGGAGAITGAIEGAAQDLLKDVEPQFKDAALAVVKGEIAAAVAAPTAATPQVVNP